MATNGKGNGESRAHPDTVAALKLFEEASAALTAARDEANAHRAAFQERIASFSSQRLIGCAPNEAHEWRMLSRAQAKLDGALSRLEEKVVELETEAARQQALDLPVKNGSVTTDARGSDGTLRDAIDAAAEELQHVDGSFRRLKGRGSGAREVWVAELKDCLRRLWSECAFRMEDFSPRLKGDRERRERLGKRFTRATAEDLSRPRLTQTEVDDAVLRRQRGDERATTRGGVL